MIQNIMELNRQILLLFLLVPLFVGFLSIFSKHFYIKKIGNINIFCYLILTLLSIFLFFNILFSSPIIYEIGLFGKYGIILIMDSLSSIFICLSSILSLFVIIYSYFYFKNTNQNIQYYQSFNFMLFGINGIFLTNDLFNLYIFFEIMFFSSLVFIFFSEKKKLTNIDCRIEAIYKYLLLGIFSSFFLLLGIIFVYSLLGSLNLSDIANKIYLLSYYGNFQLIIIVSCILFIISFGNKIALFPFHFWLPDVHPIVPAPISSILSSLLTKVGIYCIIRILYIVFYPYKLYFIPMLQFLSIITIIIGSISAVVQYDLKKILAYSTISQLGYIIFCLSLDTYLSIFTSIIYIISHSFSKLMMFLISGKIISLSHTKNIYKINFSTFRKIFPLYSLGFFIGSLCLSGIPPTIGFVAKYLLFYSFIFTASNNIFILIILSISSICTLYYTLNTWIKIFLEENIEVLTKKRKISLLENIPIFIIIFLLVYIGIFPNSLFFIVDQITRNIFYPEYYILLIIKRYL